MILPFEIKEHNFGSALTIYLLNYINYDLVILHKKYTVYNPKCILL